MGMVEEFKKFAMRGNVIDMAVGIVIGGAFGKIVTSLVGDLIMPAVGKLTGNTRFSNLFIWLGSGEKPATLEAARETGEPYLGYGNFIQTTVDFLIIALAVFLMVKLMNKLQDAFDREKAVEEAEPVEPPEDIRLLREIRDALVKAP